MPKVCRRGHVDPPFDRYASVGAGHPDNHRPFCAVPMRHGHGLGINLEPCGADLFHGDAERVMAYCAAVRLGANSLDEHRPREYGLALIPGHNRE